MIYPAVRIAVVWLLAWLLLLAARHATRLFEARVLARLRGKADHRRLATLAGMLRQAAVFLIIGTALLLSLDQVGVSIAPLLATAGVAGVAIGFGAQSLVKDIISGLFMLMDGQVSEGDWIEAGGKSGMVQEVTLRHIRLRDEAGNTHYIPNGIVSVITNSSRDYVYAVIDLPVPSDADPEKIFSLMRTIHAQMHGHPDFSPDLAGEIIIDGIEKLEASSMLLRCRIRAVPGRQMVVRREFLKRVRQALDGERKTA